MAVDKWRSYLHGQEFIIRTDHQSLLHFTDQKVVSRIQQKALMKLMDLQYKILYKKGISNVAANALSRILEGSSLLAISISTPSWLEKLQQGFEDDPQAKQLLTELSIQSDNEKGYTLQQGIIRYKGRV